MRIALILVACCLPALAADAQPPEPGAPTPASPPEPAPAEAPQDAKADTPQDPTEALFGRKCASCHTVGKGKRVGPDLKGAHERRSADWLKRLIKAPSSMLDSDPDARAMVREFNDVRMPDLGLTDAEVAALVAVIERCSSQPCNLSPAFTAVTKAVQEDFDRGRRLFTGEEPLANGGPACMSCHAVRTLDSRIPGGLLAKDLTHVFGRLGDEGLDAALRNPAFKLMNKVFLEYPIAEDEVFALRAFLYDANRTPTIEADHISLVLVGIVGAALVLVLLNAGWAKRLRGVRKPLTSKSREASA